MRGEETIADSLTYSSPESPPHARGRVDELRKVVTPTGITPACVGKSSMMLDNRIASGNHPRMRGEEPQTVTVPAPSMGITPACAGKSSRKEKPPCKIPESPPHAQGRE